MKLLIDMNLAPRWASFLAEHDLDAAHWSQLGDPHANDTEIMRHAATNGLVILTQDLDFGSILAATGEGGPSVVQIRCERPSPENAGRLVAQALVELAQEIDRGALITVDAERFRVTVLPLRNPKG